MPVTGAHWWVHWRPGAIYWAERVSGSVRSRLQGPCASWDELPIPAAAAIALCVPGEYVRIHEVALPPRHRRRFLAGLPYALEERLLREPEQYHFVPLPRNQEQGPTPVAVIERQRIQEWCDAIAARSWQLRYLVPDYLVLPVANTQSWLLDLTATPWLLRWPGGGAVLPGAGAALPEPPMSLWLAIAEASIRPRGLRVRVAPGEDAAGVRQWRARLQAQDVELEIVEDDAPRLTFLMQQSIPPRAYNLLTGPYAPRRTVRGHGRRAFPIALLTAAIVVALGTRWVAEGMRLESRFQELQQALEVTYREAFPDAQNIVDPRHQMETELARLRAAHHDSAGRADLFRWLEAIAAAQAGVNDASIQVLRFDGTRLTMEVTVPDFEALTRLRDGLAGTAEVEVEDSALADGRVHGRLWLKESG